MVRGFRGNRVKGLGRTFLLDHYMSMTRPLVTIGLILLVEVRDVFAFLETLMALSRHKCGDPIEKFRQKPYTV